MHTQSHSIEAVAYDEKRQLLRARYRNSGKTVIYEGVPQEIYDALIFSESIGGFLRRHVEGHFPARHN